jgi:cysteine desulfurase
MEKDNIYLDYSASTPIDPKVLEVLQFHQSNTHGNASSIHSYGRNAKVVLEESRDVIANSIGADVGEIFFTSGGTEADNHALIGSAYSQRRFKEKNHIIISAIEHHAVFESVEFLQKHGFEITESGVNSVGEVDLDQIENAIRPSTSMISIMHANNEVGTIQELNEISKIAKQNNITFHSDTVQTFGKIPVDVNELGIDLLSLSAHKIYGPKGIGAIYIRKGVDVDSLIHGGSQERNHRAGTENVPLIAAFAAAAKKIMLKREDEYRSAVRFCSIMKDRIFQSLKGVIFNGAEHSLPHILSISLDSNLYNVESETLLLQLDLHGVAASSGSACTSGSIQPSHVLKAMGRDEKTAKSTVRFSFGRMTTEEEIIKASNIFCDIVQRLPKNK